MPILSTVGSRTPRGRLTTLVIYGSLVVGALTMVYPFALMLSTSLCNAFDAQEFTLPPRYLTRDEALFKKVLFAKYGQTRLAWLAGVYDASERWLSWDDVRRAEEPVFHVSPDISAADQQRVDDWYAFKKTLDPASVAVYFAPSPGVEFPEYAAFLSSRYASVAELNRVYGRSYGTWSEVLPPADFFEHQRWFVPTERPDMRDWIAFKAERPASDIAVVSGRMLWHRHLRNRFVSLGDLNEATGLDVQRLSDMPFPVTAEHGPLYDVWVSFLRTSYPLRLIELQPEADEYWQPFLEKRFESIAQYNELMNAHATTWADVPMRRRGSELSGEARLLWLAFVVQATPTDLWVLNTPEEKFAQFLESRYSYVDRLNDAHDSQYASFASVPTPERLTDAVEFRTHARQWRWHFAASNYVKVLKFLIQKERALFNTIVLVALTVFTALTVNPLAAYVLSRGDQRLAHKVLIFCLATMAFPAEVAMIPGFLLLRDLGMLNTFAALVIPGMANGYAIFLLKGFFDSIPRELYEAASIDGARERQMFLFVTYPMCKPILAVIALSAFTAAYGGFMWAFLVCQDSSMWTLMVWLYVFQSSAATDPGLIMASLVLASIPTLVVFLFAQNIIMRGIIIPTMK